MRAVLLSFFLLLGLAGAAPAQTQTPAAVNGCIYYSSLPTLANGQRNAFLCDVNGKLLTTGGGGAITIGAAITGCGTVGGLIYNAVGNVVGCTSGWTTDGANALTGAAATTLAVGGATIGTNAAAITGTMLVNGNITTSQSFVISATGTISWFGRGILTSPAAGSIRFGTVDAAAPVAQTIDVQSVAAGTLDVAGQLTTVKGSAGTGSGAGGNYAVQLAITSTTGTTQNTFGNALLLSSAGAHIFGNPNSSATSLLIATGPGTSGTTNTNTVLQFKANNANLAYIGRLSSTLGFFDGAGGAVLLMGGTGTAGVWNSLIQFGGATASFPALKRSTTALQARLADDSAFTNIQGKIQTDTNYTAGATVPTGYMTFYDGAGTAYKIPACLASGC